jgi:3-hydroxybutyryl-CoA dehydrogenase
MAIRKVGVLGAGLMGSGIAEVCARSGYDTVVREVSDDFLKKGLSRIEGSLSRAVEKGKVTTADAEAARRRISGTTRLDDVSSCDLIIEAIVENLDLKKETYRDLDRLCAPSTIFCSNTSSLTITELSAVTSRPDRFAGLHFFNPVPVMKLVEVVRTIATSEETAAVVFEFARSLGKEPIRTHDNSGFIVNRLLVPYLLDAVRALEEGVGSKEDIDKGMELGCGYPMGPFKLLDFVGLDTTYAIAEIMYAEYREKRFAPPPLLKRMVLAGRYGKKAGRGFYEYGGKA